MKTPIFSYYNKIEIEDGTLLQAPVGTAWEIILPKTIKFNLNFYKYHEVELTSYKPLTLSNTDAILVWDKPHPQYAPCKGTPNIVLDGTSQGRPLPLFIRRITLILFAQSHKRILQRALQMILNSCFFHSSVI